MILQMTANRVFTISVLHLDIDAWLMHKAVG